MEINQNFISVADAKLLSEEISHIGTPTEGRVLLLTPSSDARTSSGLFIVKTEDDKTIPRKGVVISMGPIPEDDHSYKGLLQVGAIITYGLYAGKEITISSDKLSDKANKLLEDAKLTILSFNEVIFVETNK